MRLARLRRAEEAEQRSIGAEHARQLRGELLRRLAVEVVDNVPAQNAVHPAIGLREAPLEKGRQRLKRALARVPVEVGENVLDEDLAAQLLAEEADVAADDRAEIEEDRRFARGQRRQELAERL